MDQSRRAVEAYWRSRMVDGATADEDKVAPVYKLEEICELLKTSPAGIGKEVSDYILKRLDHKSPIVKQKALRLIKYAVGKSGPEFRREMQRHSAVMRQLFHYKGHPDPLKGDSLNKAVRDTAHEAVAAIFAPDDLKAASPLESINKRIEGFGNTNFQMPADDKKSFLSEVVELGTQSIKQGLSTIAAAHSLRKDDNGSVSSYRSPALRRSLTKEIDREDRYGGFERPRESWSSSSGTSRDASGTWTQDSRTAITDTTINEDAGSSNGGIKTHEERLLETIVTAGGVRLQPTRDALQAFLLEASKLDALAMSHALEAKLHSPIWQVRMKAICVLEAILRKKDEEPFSAIESYFGENRDFVTKCAELPQVSLREKAMKVLNLLDGNQTSGGNFYTQDYSNGKPKPSPTIQLPDLIDTGDDDCYGNEASGQSQIDSNMDNPKAPVLLVDDLFGSDSVGDSSGAEAGHSREDDPFVDVSFHTNESKEDDLFSGLSVDKTTSDPKMDGSSSNKSDLLDVFSSNHEQVMYTTGGSKKDINDLISGLSLSGVAQDNKQNGASTATFSQSTFSAGSNQHTQLPTAGNPTSMLGSNFQYPLGLMQQNMLNQYATNPANYAAMGNFVAQQQLLFQNFGNVNQSARSTMDGSHSSPLPDVFQISNNPIQAQSAIMSSPKKEESKAFDFISDHLSAARGSKRVL